MNLWYICSCGFVCVCLIFVSNKITYLTPWAAYEFIKGRKQMFSHLDTEWERRGGISLRWEGRPEGWSLKDSHFKLRRSNFRRAAWEVLHCLLLKDATIHRSRVCILPPLEKKSMAVLESQELPLILYLPPWWQTWPPCFLDSLFLVHLSLSTNEIPGFSTVLPFQEWLCSLILPKFLTVLDTYYFFCCIFLEILHYPYP